jgi:replicative DNA helicase Mcm
MSIERRILEVIEKKGEASLSDLYTALPEHPRHSVRSKVSRLVRKGLLRRAGKGVYALPEGTPCEPAAANTSTRAGADTRENVSTEKGDVSPETISRDDLRRRVLRILRRQPDATPEEVASAIGAPLEGVSGIFQELIDEGLLQPPECEHSHTASEAQSGGEEKRRFSFSRESRSEDKSQAGEPGAVRRADACRWEHRRGQQERSLRRRILDEVRRRRRTSLGSLLEALPAEGEEEVRRQVLLLLQEGALWFSGDGTLMCGDAAAGEPDRTPESLQDVLRLRALKPWDVAAVMGFGSLWELLLAGEKYRRRLAEIGRYFPEKRRLLIDFEDVAALSHELADRLLESPDSELGELMELAGRLAVQHHISAEALERQQEGAEPLPLRVSIGIRGAPEKIQAREIGEPHLFGKLVCLEGIVSRAGFPFSRLRVAAFRCRYCDAITRVPQPEDVRGLQRPPQCDDCGKKAPVLDQEESDYERVQHLHVIDDISEVSDALPGVAEVVLKDDLPRIIPPGTRVRIWGVVRGTTSKKNRNRRQYLEALWLERLDSDPSEGLTQEDLGQIRKLAADPRIVERLTRSIAPHIYGMEHIKEAILYQLFSSPRVERDGRWIRGEIHILVVGEPSVGKSDTARWVHQNRLLPRSVYVDCENATGAGLTVAAVKDETTGAWSIEAGAAVLADEGLLALDEFDKLSREHRKALHTLMEAGVVDVAKAGVKGTFPARCSVLACANPKYGRFDEYRPISEQINLPPTILSRFDLIFLVRDDLSITREVARHVLGEEEREKQGGDVIPPELLRKYIAYARRNVHPELSMEARKVIEEFYIEARERAMNAEDMPIPLTVRQLRAAIRLSKARARARLSNTATREDAMAAINLIKTSLSQVGLDLETGRIDIDKVYVGVTKSQRDKIKEILSIIRELEDQYGTARKEEILQLAEKRGISKEFTLECIEKLRNQGDIFEPKYDHFKTT